MTKLMGRYSGTNPRHERPEMHKKQNVLRLEGFDLGLPEVKQDINLVTLMLHSRNI